MSGQPEPARKFGTVRKIFQVFAAPWLGPIYALVTLALPTFLVTMSLEEKFFVLTFQF
jgi:hypothetical protein